MFIIALIVGLLLFAASAYFVFKFDNREVPGWFFTNPLGRVLAVVAAQPFIVGSLVIAILAFPILILWIVVVDVSDDTENPWKDLWDFIIWAKDTLVDYYVNWVPSFIATGTASWDN